MVQRPIQPGTLYLIPTPLFPGAVQTLSPQVVHVLHRTMYYIVENARTARRFMKSMNTPHPIHSLSITELDKHREDHPAILLTPLMEGHDVGVMSEAGCPGIADPGSALVMHAHTLGLPVVPLTGPSSIILALMASGLNGQRFQFHGYLSPKKDQLAVDLRRLEEISRKDSATQIFIETPYRNLQVIEIAFKTLKPATLFCVAMDLTSDTEFVRTLPIAKWKNTQLPEAHKRPAVFLMGVL